MCCALQTDRSWPSPPERDLATLQRMTDRLALTLTGDATRDVPHLESRLGTDATTSIESARILAAIGDLASLDVLVRFAGHRDPFMQRIAVEALEEHPASVSGRDDTPGAPA